MSSWTLALKVFGFMCQWIRTRFLTSVCSVSSVQHLEELIRVLRWIAFEIFCPEHVSSLDRKPFTPVPYLNLAIYRVISSLAIMFAYVYPIYSISCSALISLGSLSVA